ncbi:PHP domain-containing protein [Clostridium polynesiense]|uniref:PHP domain-containing protein n=1 Tax=Clostridium polynesiense TaxID=1325933 RepID=UPI00058D08AF|nr:PHP domain-containing protein [Clostridium polynesiense]
MGKEKSKKQDRLKIEELKHYYGIPHCHTNYSTGKSSPSEALEYAKNNKLDYIIITDHNDYLEDKAYYKSNITTKWSALEKYIYNFNKKNKSFVALIGFEVHTHSLGDINVLNSPNYFKGTIKKLDNMLLWFIFNKNCIGGINHPGKEILSLAYSELLNKYIRYVEIGNGLFPNRYKRYDKLYFSLLDKGWMLAPINSQDNHKLNYGDSENLTVALCPELSRKNIIKAFKNLSVYSTESRSLRLSFSINNTIMGGIISYEENLNLNFVILAEDKNYKIKEIEIISSCSKIIKSIDNLNQERIRYIYSHRTNLDESYYVVRVYTSSADNKSAVSAPIFIKH